MVRSGDFLLHNVGLVRFSPVISAEFTWYIYVIDAMYIFPSTIKLMSQIILFLAPVCTLPF